MTSRHTTIPAVYVYFLDDEGRVLLQRRGQDVGFMPGKWAAGAAGHLERGESVAECAVREVAEEIGITLETTDVVPAFAASCIDRTGTPDAQRSEYAVVVPRWNGEPRIMEPTKCTDLGWFALSDLPDGTSPYERPFLENLARSRPLPFLDIVYDPRPW